jgi:hypothetical protein
LPYPTHLIRASNRFYYRIKVPTDLNKYFPCAFNKQSLRTPDLREAKTMMAAMEYKIHRSFTLLRTGMLPDDIAFQVVRDIAPSKGRVADSSDTRQKQALGKPQNSRHNILQ